MNFENLNSREKINPPRSIETKKDYIENFLKRLKKPEDIAMFVASISTLSDPTDIEIAQGFIQKILERAGLPHKEIASAWKNNATTGGFKDTGKEDEVTKEDAEKNFLKVVSSNILSIQSLEGKQPGICKFLFDNYGIRNFGRFSLETWLSQ